MTSSRLKTATAPAQETPNDAALPLERSVGYQVRMTHRALQRYLQIKIKPHGVTLGTWYFLRALWHEDGLTQRELSRRIGTREPTTMTAILAMEAGGLVKRVRNSDDRRKQNVFLTPKGKRLKTRLLPLARDVVNTATSGLSEGEIDLFLGFLGTVQRNLEPLMPEETETDIP
jgi:MarR family transcriptional regulator, organic hydroperoxide resistance regulator